MRHTPRMATLATAGLLAALLVAVGCASRKQVTTTDVETPPPPPPAQEETTPPPPPPQQQTEPESRATLTDAFFDFDEASLRADAKAALESNAKWMQSNSGASVIVEGHCDERGSVEYNLALGERRAKAAKEFLVSYGIAANRITTISYGKERPFDPGHDESAWAQNRRAHFVAK
ncbi:MAG TPA: peptidoglycan-associated lipoprotein Pal [Candidatus Eisenbacteria bacterium]|nr:peptidoglycan-associated lipoprotein Pal [Candidatus Eisenbacteria bacterium]